MSPQFTAAIAVALAVAACSAYQPEDRSAELEPGERQPPIEAAIASRACPVTKANDQGLITSSTVLRHGNEWLATNVYPDGTVDFRPHGAGCVDGDGALWMKWPWWRKVPGELEVETSSLAGQGVPLKGASVCCYGRLGFQPVGVGFPRAGCWRVTARLGGNRALAFVTLVKKHGEGPPRCDSEAAAQ